MKDLAIIVPYRDREEHLKQFIPYMKYFTQEFMDALEPLVAKEFKYGMSGEVEQEEVEE